MLQEDEASDIFDTDSSLNEEEDDDQRLQGLISEDQSQSQEQPEDATQE